MQKCKDESEIYNYQRIQLWNSKFINGIMGGGGVVGMLDRKNEIKIVVMVED